MRVAAHIGAGLCCVSPAQDAPPEIGAPVPLEPRTLAIVRDGESWYFDRFTAAMMKELEGISKGTYELTIKDDFNGADDPDQIGSLLVEAIAGADVVYAAGAIATERASKMEPGQRAKPVVGGALQFADNSRQISEGRSTTPNFSFTTSPQRIAYDLALAKRLSGSSTIHAILDELLKDELEDIDTAKAKLNEALGIDIAFVWSGPTAAEALAAVPASAKVAYATILPRMAPDERRKLYAGLAKRGVPSISMVGQMDVKNFGALAGLNPDNLEAFARRSALSIHQLFGGASTADLPVLLPIQDHLVINASTAETTGWSPDYDTALEADFFDEPRTGQREITLVKAMELAAAQNIDVLIAREGEVISRGDTAIARSALLPQIGVDASHGRTGFSDRINPATTPQYAHQSSYGLELRQILFNDEAFSGFKALRQTATSKRYDTLSAKYDVMEAAAAAYFDLLIAEALYTIEKKNLRLTQDNLELARLRESIGAGEATEVYRWEQNRARGKASLIQRDSNRQNAMVELSRVVGEPRETRWMSTEWTNLDYDPKSESGPDSKTYLTLGDKEFAFLDDSLNELVKSKREFQKFGSFLQFMSVENSPELFSFDHLLAAQGIVLGQKQRSFYLPEVAGTLGYDRVVSGSDASETDGENEVTAGFQFSIPLYEGGKRKAEVAQQKATIRQLAAQRERAVQRIEQRTFAAVYGIGAAHPNIRLSDQALAAARKNFNAVQEKYLLGAASILDLLDAQSSLLRQEQEDAVASYSYMQQINSVQRAIAWFEFQKTPEEKKVWTQLLSSFLRDGKVTTRNGTFPRPPAAVEARAIEAVENSTPPRTTEVPVTEKKKTEPAAPKRKPFRLFPKRR